MSSLASAAAERHVVLVKAKELLNLSRVLPDDYELRTVVAGMSRPLLWALYRAAVSPEVSSDLEAVVDPQCTSQRDRLRKQWPAHVFLSRLVEGGIDPDTAWSPSYEPDRVQGEERAQALLRLLRAKVATEPKTVGKPRTAAQNAGGAAVPGQEVGR
jgi:hypothetical protein